MTSSIKEQSEGHRTLRAQSVPWGRQTAKGSTAACPGRGDALLCPARRWPRPPCPVVPSSRQEAPRTPGRRCGNGQVTRLASEGIWDSPALRRKAQQEPRGQKGTRPGDRVRPHHARPPRSSPRPGASAPTGPASWAEHPSGPQSGLGTLATPGHCGTPSRASTRWGGGLSRCPSRPQNQGSRGSGVVGVAEADGLAGRCRPRDLSAEGRSPRGRAAATATRAELQSVWGSGTRWNTPRTWGRGPRRRR